MKVKCFVGECSDEWMGVGRTGWQAGRQAGRQACSERGRREGRREEASEGLHGALGG